MIFGRSEVSTTTRRYTESFFTKSPFNRCSIRINMGQPDAMFISFLPGRWKGVRTKTITGVSSQLGWWASVWPSSEKAKVGVHHMVLAWLWKKKVEMSPFPQSISIQVGPGAHFVAYTCKEKSGLERERVTPSIASFHRRSNSSTFQIRMPL